jgi:hypothetical protein
VDWGIAQTLSDEELGARLYRPAVPRSSRKLEPDYAWIHQELKRPGVTCSCSGRSTSAITAKAASLKRSLRAGHISAYLRQGTPD